MPDDGEATAKVSQDVREIVRNGGTTPARPTDTSPPRPDVVAGRDEEDGKPREEVGTSGPPDPRGPRDESEERRAGREEPSRSGPPNRGTPAVASRPPLRRPLPEADADEPPAEPSDGATRVSENAATSPGPDAPALATRPSEDDQHMLANSG